MGGLALVILALCTLWISVSAVVGGHFKIPEGCTAIAVAPKASVDGGMTTHNNDCEDCDFRLARVPARDYKPGDMRPIYPARFAYPRYVGFDRGDTFHPMLVQKGLWNWTITKPIGYIPQVSHTFSYIDGGYGIINEHQLAIGESTCGSKLVAKPIYAGGSALFDISELGRVAMERCETARCAVKIMGELAERHGYYGCEWEGSDAQAESGEAFTVVDKHEAWVFHISPDDTGKSAVWIAQRVPDDHIAVVTNGFIIRTFDLNNPDYFLASANIHDVAQRAGLWNPSMGPLDFQTVYGLRVSVYHEEYIARRWWRVLSTAAPSLGLRGNLTTWELPFSVKPDRLLKVQDIMALNRDHFEGTPYDMTQGVAAGPFGNPNRYDMYMDPTREVPPELMGKGHFERPISMFRTSYSFVTQSRSWLPDVVGGRVWFGNAAPHATCYTPFWSAASSIPVAYQSGSLFKFTHDSAWWIFTAVANYAERAYRYIIEDVQAEFTRLENQAFDQSRDVERKAMDLLATEKNDAQATKGYLNDWSSANADLVVKSWWDLFWNLLGKYHDGYKLTQPIVETIKPYHLFFPRSWLEAIDWWRQPEGDLAAREPIPILHPTHSTAASTSTVSKSTSAKQLHEKTMSSFVTVGAITSSPQTPTPNKDKESKNSHHPDPSPGPADVPQQQDQSQGQSQPTASSGDPATDSAIATAGASTASGSLLLPGLFSLLAFALGVYVGRTCFAKRAEYETVD